MVRRTLIDFFDDLAATDAEFLAYDDGYRTWSWTYRDLASAARRFAARLAAHGIASGAAVVVWSENRPEWVAALWGALLDGVVLVPIDYRASADFLQRVAGIVDAKAILVGNLVDAESLGNNREIWTLSEIFRLKAEATNQSRDHAQSRDDARGFRLQAEDHPRPDIGPDTTAEIIFTSGATAEPKGVVLTHRNILANIVPLEREVMKYRKWARPFTPIRFLNLLPLSHMFGQAMATFVPPMLGGVVIFMRGYNPVDIVAQVKQRRISVVVSVPKILDVLREHVLRVAPEASTPSPRRHWMQRWWHFRKIHRMFGWKFWAFVV